MASFSRGISPFFRASSSICAQCRRSFVTSAHLNSGHNKWSKIKHGKALNDAKKTSMRTEHAKTITLYTKLYGADPNFNPQLASAISAAKKASVPKAVIEVAIARGQGKSSSGVALEALTFDAIMPPSVALLIEVETESRIRVLQDLNAIVKKAKGASSPTKFFFTRAGRVVFEKSPDAEIGIDEVMDDAIEAGAEDLEGDEEGNIVVWTQPNQTTQVCQDVGNKFGLKVMSSDIIWTPNEDTKSKIDSSSELETLLELLKALREYPDVQAIYSNVARGNVSDAEWAQIEENLDV